MSIYPEEYYDEYEWPGKFAEEKSAEQKPCAEKPQQVASETKNVNSGEMSNSEGVGPLNVSSRQSKD